MKHETVITHVVHSLAVGGLENGVINITNTRTPGVRHVIVCMTTDGILRSRLAPMVTVTSLGKRPGHDIRAFLKLVRLLRTIRPHVMHSRNWATFDAVIAARLARVPAVVHGEHGRDIADPDGRNPRRKHLRRTFAALVDRFVTVSEDLRRWLVTDVGIPAAKVLTICNGVDTTRFAPLDRAAARAALGLPATPLVVGTVGRLDPVKDQAGLIQAFARVRSAHPTAMLLIAGGGPCRDGLQALVAALGLGEHICLLGERNDVPRILGAIDVFVLPSIAEGSSNTILEAMATGLPVVATRVGGNGELIDDRVSGWLVPRRDPNALAAAIGVYLGNPALRALHGRASRERVIARFGLDHMRTAYEGLYASLADGVHRRSA